EGPFVPVEGELPEQLGVGRVPARRRAGQAMDVVENAVEVSVSHACGPLGGKSSCHVSAARAEFGLAFARKQVLLCAGAERTTTAAPASAWDATPAAAPLRQWNLLRWQESW